MQGLHAIVHICQNLQGLNLVKIPASSVEPCLLLWELLSSVKKLTHLAIELCMLIPGDRDDDNKQKLIGILRRCESLQALEIVQPPRCVECEKSPFVEDLLFAHFPSLMYVRAIRNSVHWCS